MTRLSSIFSFDTLRASFRPSRAVVLAVALLAAGEGGLRLAAPRLHWRTGVPSFDLLVSRYRYELVRNRPALWLLGNSTLERGVDFERLASLAEVSVQALPVGSGTLAGQVAMLDYFLRRTPAPPRQVVFCLTKDDLNRQGYRAEISRRYLDYGTWRALTVDGMFRLDDVRKPWLELLGNALAPPPPAPAPVAAPPFDGQLSAAASNHLAYLALDFAFDESAFPRLASLSRKFGFQIALCLMPVTDVYLQFHDQRYPRLSCDSLHARIQALCDAHGFVLMDFSRLAVGQYGSFMDAYHMNDAGRAWFTPLLANALPADAPGRRPR